MAGVRLQAIIEGSVADSSTLVTLPSASGDPDRCEYFYLSNTHATQVLYWSGGSAAGTGSMPLAAGKTILVAAMLTQSEGVYLYGSAAATTYAIQPVG
jgi:hypothetical protein